MSTKHKNLSSRSSTAHLSTDFSLAIARLLEHVNARDQLVIRLVYETGITPRELVELKKTDIDFANKTLVLREETTKHHVSRHISCTLSLLKQLSNYAQTNNSEYLFSTRQSTQLSTRRVEQIFKDASKEARLAQTLTPQDCRTHYIYLAKKQAQNEEELRTLTGLKSIQKRRTLTEHEFARLERTLKKAPQRTQDIVQELLSTGAKLGDYVNTISTGTHKVSQLTARRIEQIVSHIGIEAKIDRLTPEVLRATALEKKGGGAQ